jgi:hypothetical protein
MAAAIGEHPDEVISFGWYDEKGNLVEENETEGLDPEKNIPPDLREEWKKEFKQKNKLPKIIEE